MNVCNKSRKSKTCTSHGYIRRSNLKGKKAKSKKHCCKKSCVLSPDEEIKQFALLLKKSCDNNGIEIEPKMSAEIIYMLGLVHFKKSPDKISLIKCVGLLNSAIARKPSNLSKMKEELSKVCKIILQLADAQNETADLVVQASHIKAEIEIMRTESNRAFKVMKTVEKQEQSRIENLCYQQMYKIISVKNIQERNAEHYKRIMKNLCFYCENVMGPKPCDFAIIGMGSLARKEITPYSDFEHIILLENQNNYKDHLEYFRWFSVIFHTVVLNLQETIIPSLNIMHLNDKTSDLGDWFFDDHTSGISFDGMMPHASKFPLGRTQHTEKKPWTTELIKPVNKMLQYLRSDENLKNGYHLSDILMETCFVYGNQTLHLEFENGIQACKKSKTLNETLRDIKEQVIEDLDKFATRIKLVNLKPDKKLNVKQMFYRTSTLFITALGKICGAESSSCFDIINELAEKKRISHNTRIKLSFAVATACEIRTNVYMKEKSQRDYIQPHKNAKTFFDEILKIVDKDSVISYFQITYCLQLRVMKLLGIEKPINIMSLSKSRYHFYSSSHLFNITILYALGLDELILTLMHNLKKAYHSTFSVDNEDNESLVDSKTSNSSTEDTSSSIDDSDRSTYIVKKNSYSADDTGLNSFFPNDANLSSFIVDASSSFSANTADSRQEDVGSNDDNESLFDKWLLELETEVNFASKFLSPPKLHTFYKNFSDHLRILLSTHDVDESLEIHMLLLEVLQRFLLTKKGRKIFANKEMDKIKFFLRNAHPQILGQNFRYQSISSLSLDESIVYKQQYNNPEFTFPFCFATANAWLKMGNYEKSLICWKIALGVCLSLDVVKTNIVNEYFLMIMYSGVGACLLKLDQYEESLMYLKIAIDQIEKHTYVQKRNVLEMIVQSSNEEAKADDTYMLLEVSRATTYHNVGICFMKLQRFKEAFPFLNKALDIAKDDNQTLATQQIFSDKKIYNYSMILYDLGSCHMQQNCFREAVEKLQIFFDHIKLKAPFRFIATRRFELLLCYMELYQRERIENYLKDLHKARKFTKSIVKVDSHHLTYAIELQDFEYCRCPAQFLHTHYSIFSKNINSALFF